MTGLRTAGWEGWVLKPGLLAWGTDHAPVGRVDSATLFDRPSADVLQSVLAIDGALLAVRRVLFNVTVMGVVTGAAGVGWHVRLGLTSPDGTRYVTLRLARGVIERHETRKDAASYVLRAATSWLRLPVFNRPQVLDIT